MTYEQAGQIIVLLEALQHVILGVGIMLLGAIAAKSLIDKF